jgi:hypothetical protein
MKIITKTLKRENIKKEALINTGKLLQSFFSPPLCNGINCDFLKSVDKLYLNY